ncbi:hypothetical protein BK011_09675 [Tenericutes bacterium MZ-XQ]|nr:hypothetical protein BK011_09675 [Tenericutes bacterium MZ-XQ]
MKIKKLWIIPMVLIVVSVIASVIAFNQTKRLEYGYLYVNNEPKTTVYEGEYVAIIGQTGVASYIEVSLLDEYVEIITYRDNYVMLDRYHLQISYDGINHEKALVKSLMENEKVLIDEMSEYLVILDLKKNHVYHMMLEVIDDDPFTDDIDIVFVNLPEHVYNLKTLMEGIAVTTLVFTVISSITIVTIIILKKDS